MFAKILLVLLAVLLRGSSAGADFPSLAAAYDGSHDTTTAKASPLPASGSGDDPGGLVSSSGGSPAYGHILEESLAALWAAVRLRPEDVVYDLGSGFGQLILYTAMRGLASSQQDQDHAAAATDAATDASTDASPVASRTMPSSAEPSSAEPPVQGRGKGRGGEKEERREERRGDRTEGREQLAGVVGIELSATRLTRSCEVLATATATATATSATTTAASSPRHAGKDKEAVASAVASAVADTPVRFIQGDFLRADLTDASVVYIATTAYSLDFMHALTLRLGDLSIGSRVVCCEQPLPEKAALLVGLKLVRDDITLPTSWSQVSPV